MSSRNKRTTLSDMKKIGSTAALVVFAVLLQTVYTAVLPEQTTVETMSESTATESISESTATESIPENTVSESISESATIETTRPTESDGPILFIVFEEQSTEDGTSLLSSIYSSEQTSETKTTSKNIIGPSTPARTSDSPCPIGPGPPFGQPLGPPLGPPWSAIDQGGIQPHGPCPPGPPVGPPIPRDPQ